MPVAFVNAYNEVVEINIFLNIDHGVRVFLTFCVTKEEAVSKPVHRRPEKDGHPRKKHVRG